MNKLFGRIWALLTVFVWLLAFAFKYLGSLVAAFGLTHIGS